MQASHRPRRHRLPGTAATFFGLLFVFWAWGGLDAHTGAADLPDGDAAQPAAADASRKLLADDGEDGKFETYAIEMGNDIGCTLAKYCFPQEDCQDLCNEDKDCPGYMITSGPVPVGQTCSLILREEPDPTSNKIVFRKPGHPCLIGDTVRSGGFIGTVIANNGKQVVFETIPGGFPQVKDIGSVDRVSTYGTFTCDPDPESKGLYPPEQFSDSQLRQGAFLLHSFGVLYMFFGLAIVCDDYFVPALEVITVKMQLSDDVAGATFMAAGGSAPELFTSVIGVFVAESEVGFGTIIGSAVFNVLFVIGACSLATHEMAKDIGGLPLTWWPLARDSVFYLVDLLVLMAFFLDKKIEIWESLILLLLYAAYVVFMSQNVRVYKAIRNFLDRRSGAVVPADENNKRRPTHQEAHDAGQGLSCERTRARSNSTSRILTKQTSSNKVKEVHDKSAGDNTPGKGEEGGGSDNDDGDDDGWSPTCPSEGIIKYILLFPLNFVLWLTLPSGATLGEEKEMYERQVKLTTLAARMVERGVAKKGSNGTHVLPGTDTIVEHASALVPEDDDVIRGEDDEDTPAEDLVRELIDSFKESNSSGHAQAAAFLGWTSEAGGPAVYAAELKQLHGRLFGWLFFMGFFGSILWIGGFTYLMVWWAETVGKALGVSEVIMGITVLAAGTSVPDLISSVIVARDGKGDMAVSSSIGSNIFDATFGLPLPWFLWSMFKGGETITVKANALASSVLMLVAMLLSVIASVALLGWRLNIRLGGLSLINYAIFVTITILMSVDKIPTIM